MSEFEVPVYLLNVGWNRIEVEGYEDPTVWQHGDPAAFLDTEGKVWVPVRWNEEAHPYYGLDNCDDDANRDAAAVAQRDLWAAGFDAGDFILDVDLYVDDVIGLPTVEWGLKVYSKRALDAIFAWPDGPAARYGMVTTMEDGSIYDWWTDQTFPQVKERFAAYIATPYPLDSNPRIVRTK